MMADAVRTRFKIRKAVLTDVDEIYRVHTEAIQRNCRSHYSENAVRIWVGRQAKASYAPFIEDGQIVVAQYDETQENERVLGFGHIVPDTILDRENEEKSFKHAVQIRGLFVDPSCGHTGVGGTLLEHLEKTAVEEGAGTLTVHSSLNAVSFYKKFGFVPLEVVSHQVSEDACLQCMKMIKTL